MVGTVGAAWLTPLSLFAEEAAIQRDGVPALVQAQALAADLSSLAPLGVGLALAAVLAWVWLLRRQVQKQTIRIREQVESEAATARKLALIWESSSDGMLLTDEHGTIVLANAAFGQMFGRSGKDLTGHQFNVLLQPGEFPGLLEAYTQRFRARTIPGSQEIELKLWDGREDWFEITASFFEHPGQPCLVLSQFRNVTERKRAELALELHKRQLDAIVHSALVAIITVDEQNRIVIFNRAAETMFGVTDGSWRQQCVKRFLKFAGSPEWQDIIQQSEVTGNAMQHSARYRQFSGTRGDGTAFPIELCVRQVAADEEKLLIITCRDLTETIEAEKTRRMMETELNQAKHFEAIGTLAGGIAHDFNNIVAAIMGNADLAKFVTSQNDPTREYLDAIVASSHRAKNLVQQILTFARKHALDKKAQPLGPIVQEAVRLLRSSIPAGVQMEIDIAASTPLVYSDAHQIYQIVVNLGTNAWHALESSTGRISIALSAVAAGNRLSPLPQATAGVRLTISDNGKGMDARTKERVFDPFFTTKEPGKGTGLGLSVVHGIVSDHGGHITVESQEGAGTTVDIFLPAAIPESGSSNEPTGQIKRGNGERILWVDDEEFLARNTRKLFPRLNYEVDVFTSPEAALAAFNADPSRYDLLMTDFNMPQLSGIELIEQVRKLRAGIPVILCSGFLNDSLHQLARAHGVNRLMSKPASPEETSATIAAVLAGRPRRLVQG